MNPSTVSLCFPAFNEEQNLPLLLKHVSVYADRLLDDYEVIIIDDGSRDGTANILTQLCISYPRVRVITHPHNLGYGAAVKSGLQSSRSEYVFFSDADRQFDIKELSRFLVAIKEADVVIGYRAPRRDPWPRKAAAVVWNFIFRVFFNLPYRDIDCAFKLFRKSILEKIDLDTVVSTGAVFSPELLLRLREESAVIKELPVSHFPRQYGSPTGLKISVIVRAFKDLVWLWKRKNFPNR